MVSFQDLFEKSLINVGVPSSILSHWSFLQSVRLININAMGLFKECFSQEEGDGGFLKVTYGEEVQARK